MPEDATSLGERALAAIDQSIVLMLDRGIEMNRQARNQYGWATAVGVALTPISFFVLHSPVWWLVAGVTLLFALLAIHAEHLRRKLATEKERRPWDGRQ